MISGLKVFVVLLASVFAVMANYTLYQCEKPKEIDCPHGQPYSPCLGKGSAVCDGAEATQPVRGLFGVSPSKTSDKSTGDQKTCWYACICKYNAGTNTCVCDNTTQDPTLWAKWDFEDCILGTGIEQKK